VADHCCDNNEKCDNDYYNCDSRCSKTYRAIIPGSDRGSKKFFHKIKSSLRFRSFAPGGKNSIFYRLMRNIIKASLRRYYPVQVIRVDEKSSLSVGMSGKCSIFCAPSVFDSVINTVKVYDALTSINIARCSGKVNLKFS
jgi:hypothetical protein